MNMFPKFAMVTLQVRKTVKWTSVTNRDSVKAM